MDATRSSRWQTVIAWGLVALVALLWANHKSGGRLFHELPTLASSVDGTYVCGEYGWPMKVRIEGGKGDLDFGFVRARGMRVERRGETLALSGGVAADGQGRVLSAQERRAVTGGNDVDLFRISDDGQSLRLDLGDGKLAKFVRQPR